MWSSTVTSINFSAAISVCVRLSSARDQLILNYAPLVKYVAGRMSAALPSHVDEADLISYGLPCISTNLGYYLLGSLDVHVNNRYPGALPGICFGYSSTDALACTGNDSNTILELHDVKLLALPKPVPQIYRQRLHLRLPIGGI